MTNPPITHNLSELPSLTNWGDDAWRKDAECFGADTENFFPTKERHGSSALQVAKSRLICVRCTVRKECLNFALENHIVHGIWGGIVPRDRRKVDKENPDTSMPVYTIIKDLRRVRGARPTNPFIDDFAKVVGVSHEEAHHLITHADTERI